MAAQRVATENVAAADRLEVAEEAELKDANEWATVMVTGFRDGGRMSAQPIGLLQRLRPLIEIIQYVKGAAVRDRGFRSFVPGHHAGHVIAAHARA